MLNDFQTEDMKKVFSSILLRLEKDTDFSSLETPEKQKLTESTDAPVSLTTESIQSKSQKKINVKDFASTTLARMNNCTQKSKEALKRKQEKQNEIVKNSMQNKPEINKTSHKLGRRDEKIFERAEKELTAMNKRIEEKRRKLLEEKESKLMKELTFKPKLSTRGGVKRNIDDFFEYNLEWKRRSDKRVEMKRVEKEEQETSELKFAPEIDSNSLSLVEQMGINKPIEIRLLERHQLKEKKLTEMRKEQLYPFKPTLQSKNSIRQPKKSPDVFNRLFSLSIDSNRPDKSPRFGDPRKSKSFAFSTEKSLDITFS